MTTRRGRGEGGLHWDEKRQRWIATADLGFDGRGKRIRRRASGITKTEARDQLKEILRDRDDGLAVGPKNYTVSDAVTYWLTYGLSGRAEDTVSLYKGLAEGHILPSLGSKRLHILSAEDIDRWLKSESKSASTRTLRMLHSILNRSVKNAQARDRVKRNVVALCDVPAGRPGRPSKSLTLDQAVTVLDAARALRLYAYVTLSILIGARPEELRALRWEHVDLDGSPESVPPVPPSISVLRSVRKHGDTKTRKSRRRLAMPLRCVESLRSHAALMAKELGEDAIRPDALVFPSRAGTELDLHNLRRQFRNVLKAAKLPSQEWTLREMRHTFVSLLSDDGMALEDIARLVGHQGSTVTELVYRQQLRPVLEDGATAMDRIFGDHTEPVPDSSGTGQEATDADGEDGTPAA
jgi:integrase